LKKLLTLFLSLILIGAFTISAAASSVSVATELTNLRSYYAKTTEFTTLEETLTMASMGMISGRKAFIPEADGSAGTLATQILAKMAAGEEADAEPLAKMQNEDGSFGSVSDHCYAMMALSAKKALYNSKKAYEFLMSLQKEDGSFGGSVKETALAVSVLAFSENEAEKQAVKSAVTYLIAYQADNAIDVAWQIIGITDAGVDANTAGNRDLLEKLLSYQYTEDYSFYRTKNDTKTDPEATITALAALDAINQDSSMYHRLTENGTLSFYDPADMKPLILFGAVLLAVSIGFWIFIFVHKKSTKTLEETKTY